MLEVCVARDRSRVRHRVVWPECLPDQHADVPGPLRLLGRDLVHLLLQPDHGRVRQGQWRVSSRRRIDDPNALGAARENRPCAHQPLRKGEDHRGGARPGLGGVRRVSARSTFRAALRRRRPGRGPIRTTRHSRGDGSTIARLPRRRGRRSGHPTIVARRGDPTDGRHTTTRRHCASPRGHDRGSVS